MRKYTTRQEISTEAGRQDTKQKDQTDRETERQRQTERQRDRETERQRDRETERQRDRETERQRDRETERQTDRQTETDRETKRQRDKETDRQTENKLTYRQIDRQKLFIKTLNIKCRIMRSKIRTYHITNLTILLSWFDSVKVKMIHLWTNTYIYRGVAFLFFFCFSLTKGLRSKR